MNSQGLETMMAVNHLSHFYLTSALLGLLKNSESTPRVINVSSRNHLHGGKLFKNDVEPLFEDFFLKKEENQKKYEFGM